MWIFDMFNPNACSLEWRKSLDVWTWEEYKENKEKLNEKVILVDMIWHPVNWSKEISDEMFSWIYPDWTIFALYCHSWGSSWYLQMQLSKMLDKYTFINIKWWILAKKIDL